jgi:hypothetical protein
LNGLIKTYRFMTTVSQAVKFNIVLIMDSSEENKNPDEEAVIIDPITLKPELYSAAVANDTTKVISLLQQQVPGTFIDAASGWTVRAQLAPRSIDDCLFDRSIEDLLLSAFFSSLCIGRLCMEM